MNTIIALFEHSDIAAAIREDDLLFPMLESVHVLAICLVVGSIIAVDLRLLGLASRQRSVQSLTRSILPITWSAFLIAVAAGVLLFISHATKYLENSYFVAKLFLIAAAGLNMAIFQFVTARDLPAWDMRLPPPSGARIAGAFSILLWIAVIACGRWIGFTMPVE